MERQKTKNKKILQLRGHRQLLPKKKGIGDGDDEAKNRSRKRGPRTRTSRRREGSPPISRTEPPSDSTSSSSPALRCRATLFLLFPKSFLISFFPYSHLSGLLSIKNASLGGQLIQFLPYGVQYFRFTSVLLLLHLF